MTAAPGAVLAGTTERMSGRFVLHTNVGVLNVCVLPCVVTEPPPVAITLVLVPQASVVAGVAGIDEGVKVIEMGDVKLPGADSPTLFVRVTVTVCPAESVMAIVSGSTQAPTVVAVNPAPDVWTTLGEISKACGNDATTVYGGRPPKM